MIIWVGNDHAVTSYSYLVSHCKGTGQEHCWVAGVGEAAYVCLQLQHAQQLITIVKCTLWATQPSSVYQMILEDERRWGFHWSPFLSQLEIESWKQVAGVDLHGGSWGEMGLIANMVDQLLIVVPSCFATFTLTGIFILIFITTISLFVTVQVNWTDQQWEICMYKVKHNFENNSLQSQGGLWKQNSRGDREKLMRRLKFEVLRFLRTSLCDWLYREWRNQIIFTTKKTNFNETLEFSGPIL